MPQKNKNNEGYFKHNGKQQKKSRGLFDLPDGTESMKKTPKFDPNAFGRPISSKDIPKKKKTSFGDLPSGEGKRESIEKQRRFAEQRERERKGEAVTPRKGKAPQTISGVYSKASFEVEKKVENPTNNNMEKDVSRSRLNTAKYYTKEIGYHTKPIIIYILATFGFVLLGALGKWNGIDLRIPCTIFYFGIMFIGGIFVNRFMSLNGFAILGVINGLGGILGHTGVMANSPLQLQRLIKVMNLPYYVFNTGSNKMDSIVLVLSVIAPVAFIFLGSFLHGITYRVKGIGKKKIEEK